MSIAEKLTTIAENEQRVYDAGKKAEADLFWDEYQNNGARVDYQHAFRAGAGDGGGWTWERLSGIKHKATPTNAAYMFYRFGSAKNEAVGDYSLIADKFDFSKSTDMQYAFYSARMSNITLDLSSATNLSFAFSGAFDSSIKTLTLKVTEKWTTGANYAFAYCSGLQNLTFTEDSVIACDGLNLSWSGGLTHDSLMSVINALKSGVTKTLTLGATNLAKLTNEEKAIATQKGWTLA